jgi:hypothetical protein
MVRLLSGLAYFALLTNAINGASLPESNDALSILEAHAGIAPRSADVISPDHSLERRKGGGGRGGGSSGGSSSGGSSSGGSRGSGGSRSSGSSMTGGSTRSGSGPARSYGGGYYGGGAAVPYSAGSRTPKGLIAAPLLLGGAALAVMPGLWLYSVYPYHYSSPYRFYNASANRTRNNDNQARHLVDLVTRQSQMGANESLPVTCLCQEYSVCGCEENDDPKYLNDLVGNGSYAALNKTLVTVSDVNNTRTLIINGTLPNGTTAPGGVDDAGVALGVSKYAGYWAMGLVVLYGVML